MTRTINERPALLANFAGREKALTGAGPDWLQSVRRYALRRFEELGFPTSKLEAWKNTNVSRIARTPFAPAPAVNVERERVAGLGLDGFSEHRLVFVDGRYSPSLSSTPSLPGETHAGSLAGAMAGNPEVLEGRLCRGADYRDQAFTALNTAFMEDGGFVLVPDGVELDEPLHLIHLATGGEPAAAVHPRTLVAVGNNARVSLIESFAALDGGTYLTNAVTEIQIGENAEVEHNRFQNEGPDSFHIGTLHVRQDRDSRFTSNNFDLGGGIARLDTVTVLDGEGARCLLNGLYLTGGAQHVDNHSTLDHAKPHCQSRELYKGILDDSSRAVFNGRIIVRPGAQKTDAKQSNPNLLLSDGALVHTRPQLEIYADDVKCTHGATIGRLDRDAQFYLQTRGIGADEAFNMLVRAFAGEVLDAVRIAPLRERLAREIGARLNGAEG